MDGVKRANYPAGTRQPLSTRRSCLEEVGGGDVVPAERKDRAEWRKGEKGRPWESRLSMMVKKVVVVMKPLERHPSCVGRGLPPPAPRPPACRCAIEVRSCPLPLLCGRSHLDVCPGEKLQALKTSAFSLPRPSLSPALCLAQSGGSVCFPPLHLRRRCMYPKHGAGPSPTTRFLRVV